MNGARTLPMAAGGLASPRAAWVVAGSLLLHESGAWTPTPGFELGRRRFWAKTEAIGQALTAWRLTLWLLG